jgi:7-cyano-7-deazaguanine synthase in queuosine biosynthesis/predicted glutamine amidotransferase
MCGISGFFFRESGADGYMLSGLLKAAQERGKDGFGFVSTNIYNNMFRIGRSKDIPDVDKFTESLGRFNIGDLFLSIHRAAPETETSVKEDNLNQTCQPIIIDDLLLVHNGSVSNFILKDLESKGYQFKTLIDSEAIIAAYLHFDRDIFATMEYLSGGFAYLLYDGKKKKLYAVCSHNPLFAGYVRGYGIFFSSIVDGVSNTVSLIKGFKVEKNTMNIWEDYYFHQLKEYTICEIDLPSGMQTEKKYIPRYISNHYDPYKKKTNGKDVVIVAASGGLDSSTTLAYLKHKEKKDVRAVHFKYGHRGQEAEEIAIKEICKILDIPLCIFDIEQNMKILDEGGMLTDKNSRITTGTDEGLKTTVAWTTFRNHLFLTYMGAYAEKILTTENYDKAYLTGGFMQLTESGVYPDNSERFLESGIKFFKFSLAGTRIYPYYGMANLLKRDEYKILNELGYLERISPWLVSCDRPIVKEVEIDGETKKVPFNCSKNGLPACGSGLLSFAACKRAGIRDMRNYYEVLDDDWKISKNYLDY